jgi:Skp family chaperone for outer membrane proteins
MDCFPACLQGQGCCPQELSQQHRALQEDSKALAASNAQLQAALAASQQRAQQAENLAVGLRAEWQAGQAGQAALQEEVERLRAELQQASCRPALAPE